MRNVRSIFAGFGAGLFVGAVLSLLLVPFTPLVAQIGGGQTQSFQRAPQVRQFPTQQTHYLRFMLTFSSCTPPSGLTCYVRVGAMPYNSFITAIHIQTLTNWSVVTTMAIGVSTGSGAANVPNGAIYGATAITTAGVEVTTTAAPLVGGLTALGNAAVINGPPTVLVSGGTQYPNLVVPTTGGWDIYATLLGTATYPTSGLTVVVLEYIAPNDGSCQPFLIDQAITAVAPFTAC
jgi:hypothetical protein